MTAAEALGAARAAKIAIRVDGDDLVLKACVTPPVAILDLLSRYKPEMLALMRPGDGWSTEDFRELFEEQVGIAQRNGGLPRDQASLRTRTPGGVTKCTRMCKDRSRAHSCAHASSNFCKESLI